MHTQTVERTHKTRTHTQAGTTHARVYARTAHVPHACTRNALREGALTRGTRARRWGARVHIQRARARLREGARPNARPPRTSRVGKKITRKERRLQGRETKAAQGVREELYETEGLAGHILVTPSTSPPCMIRGLPTGGPEHIPAIQGAACGDRARLVQGRQID